MLSSALHHGYIFLTILLTVYGQFVIKWQVSLAGTPPADMGEGVVFLGRLLLNPWVISGLAGAFVAALSWMLAMSRFDLSYAYPYVSLTFPIVLLLANFLFGESMTFSKVLGSLMIVGGIILHSRS